MPILSLLVLICCSDLTENADFCSLVNFSWLIPLLKKIYVGMGEKSIQNATIQLTASVGIKNLALRKSEGMAKI